MMRFAELAAPWFSGAEIIELHREGKLDAPSGTAVRTAERIAVALRASAPHTSARDVAGAEGYPADRTVHRLVEGARLAAPAPVGCACTRCGLPGSWPIKRWYSVATATLTIRRTRPTGSPSWRGSRGRRGGPTRPGYRRLEPLLGL